MNTKPDDVTLALWLEDELEGEDFAKVEAWAATEPAQLAAREETRRWKAMVKSALPESEEPPYPDFFNSRIEAAIRRIGEPVAQKTTALPWWRAAWFMPATAAAGMVFAFWAGLRTADERTGHDGQLATAPVIYTPDSEVRAEYFEGTDDSSTVIVLEGVSAFPDSMDFRETVWNRQDDDSRATVSTEKSTPHPAR